MLFRLAPSRPLLLGFCLALAASEACADPPDFGLSIDLAPTLDIDPHTGEVDPYLGVTLSGTMSGVFDNGVGYSLSADTIHERHSLYPALDLDYLRVSGQIHRQTGIGRLRLKATNTAVFDRGFASLIYDQTDISLGIDRSFDLTDELKMRLAFTATRRFSTLRTLERYSFTPSASLSFQMFGLDALLTASYSHRPYVFRRRVDDFFSAGAVLSKQIGDLSIGLNASVESNRSSIPALNSTSFIIGPNFTYSFPID